MLKLTKKRSTKIGLPPGSMVHVGEKKVEKVRMAVIDYDQEHYQTRELESVEEAFPFKDTSTVSWLNISGLHEVEILEKIGQRYDIHPLVLEDILNTAHRPKVEVFDNYIFIVFKMIGYDSENENITIEQVSLILGPNFVITFQEYDGDVFQPVRQRIQDAKGRIRKRGADYLAYALLDVLVDHYFLVLEKLDEIIEYLDESVTEKPDSSLVQDIHRMKRELIILKKSVWPLRDAINDLVREESPIIQESTEPFLRDVHDHTIQVVDTVDAYRDMVSGILDVYLSSISNKMNEVMKVLTIIATIFIPLTFIAGIYGMNFEFMPELKWRWSYFVLISFMIAIAILMIAFFKRKKWL